MTIEVEAVVGELHAILLGNLVLSLLDHIIMKLDDAATVETDQVIMVILMGQLEHRLAAFEVVTGHDTGIIKLVEYPVDGVPTRTWIARDKTVAELLDTDTEDDLTKISQVITDLGTLLGDAATPGSIRQLIGTTAGPAGTATLRAVKAKAATDTTVTQMAVTVRGLADLAISLAQLVIAEARASRRMARQVQRLGLMQTGTLDSADVGADL